MIMIAREQWRAVGGKGPLVRGRKPLVVIHHTASPNLPCGCPLEAEKDAVRSIESHHVEKNGWLGIGYNFLITQSGHIYEGRGWDRAGAHAGTRELNETSVGIAFTIDGGDHSPTRAAMDACRDLIQQGIDTGRIASDFDLKGHRDLKATECPGDVVYHLLGSLRP